MRHVNGMELKEGGEGILGDVHNLVVTHVQYLDALLVGHGNLHRNKKKRDIGSNFSILF